VLEIRVLRADAIGGDLLQRFADGSLPGRQTLVQDDLVLRFGFQIALAQLYARTPLVRAGPRRLHTRRARRLRALHRLRPARGARHDVFAPPHATSEQTAIRDASPAFIRRRRCVYL